MLHWNLCIHKTYTIDNDRPLNYLRSIAYGILILKRCATFFLMFIVAIVEYNDDMHCAASFLCCSFDWTNSSSNLMSALKKTSNNSICCISLSSWNEHSMNRRFTMVESGICQLSNDYVLYYRKQFFMCKQTSIVVWSFWERWLQKHNNNVHKESITQSFAHILQTNISIPSPHLTFPPI